MTSSLFLLPGWGLGRGPLQATADALGATLIDLPGYGKTPLIRDFQEATHQLAETLPAGATLCGWSLGAMLALAVAARHPEKVGRLGLIAGTASFVQREGWPYGLHPTVLAEFAAGIASDAQALFPRFVGGFNRGDARAKEVTRQLLELADPLPAADVLAGGLDWLREVDLRPLLGCVQCPTLLLHGDHDPLMSLDTARTLADAIPGAQLSVFADAAHAPFISAPEAFRQRLAAFHHDASA